MHIVTVFALHDRHIMYLKIKSAVPWKNCLIFDRLQRKPNHITCRNYSWLKGWQEAVYGPIIVRTVQGLIVVHIKKLLQYRMMNVPMDPTKSSKQLSGQYILTQSDPNYKSNFLTGPYDSLQFIDNNLQKWFSDAFNFAVAVIYKLREGKKMVKTTPLYFFLLDRQCSS